MVKNSDSIYPDAERITMYHNEEKSILEVISEDGSGKGSRIIAGISILR